MIDSNMENERPPNCTFLQRQRRIGPRKRAGAKQEIPAAESIILRDSAQAGMQKVLIHKLRIKGDFREASDWLSHGKPSVLRMAFLFSVPVPRTIPVTILEIASSKDLSGPGSRSTIGFAYRAADATPIIREARRDSRESEITPGSFSPPSRVPSGEAARLGRLNQHQTATPVRSVDWRGIRFCSPVSLLR
jgi:hypothetical protein